MPPYNSKDLPSAGRRPMSLSEGVQEPAPVDADMQSIHSEDHMDTEGLRTRSPSPDSYSALQRTFSNSATTSDSLVAFNSCSSDDDVFKDDAFVPSGPSLPHPNGNTRHIERTLADKRALLRGSQLVDPQEIFSPSACVFVANLAQGSDDVTLRDAVDQAFSQYGKVHTKIKRDKDRMPFAFCQFEEQADAENALVHGDGLMILGRKCRTEPCKSNITFLVYKRSGDKILIKEAHDLLVMFGPISSVCTMEDHLRRFLQLPPAMVVTFAAYNKHRNVVQTLSEDPDYVVVSYDRDDVYHKAAFKCGSDAIMEQYYKDRRSIYLGRLPRMFTEDLVRVTVSQFGKVLDIQMKQNYLPTGQSTLYAFVEFDDEKSPQKALDFFHSKEMEAHNIRAERKKIKLPSTAQSEPAIAQRSEAASHPQGAFTSTSNTGRRFLPPPISDPFSGQLTAPVPREYSVRANGFQASAQNTTFQAPNGAGPSMRGRPPPTGPRSDRSSQSLMNWPQRRNIAPSQPFAGNDNHTQRRANSGSQSNSGMGRGQSRAGRGFPPLGTQQPTAQTGIGYSNNQVIPQQNHNQPYMGPMTDRYVPGPFNQHAGIMPVTGHGIDGPVFEQTYAQPNINPAGNLPVMGQADARVNLHNNLPFAARAIADSAMDQRDALLVMAQTNNRPRPNTLPGTQRIHSESIVNQRNMLTSVPGSAVGPSPNFQSTAAAGQAGTGSNANVGHAEFGSVGFYTETETQESPNAPPMNAPVMPAISRLRLPGLARSYSDTAERAATRAERAIEQNEAKERRLASMQVKHDHSETNQSESDLDDAKDKHAGKTKRSRTSEEPIVVANGSSGTPPAQQNASIPAAPMAMNPSSAAFAHQYPPPGMAMATLFPTHMTQQGRPNFMTYTPPHRMTPGMSYGMPGPMMPVSNPMGQGMVAPNMMPYGMQPHPMPYGYSPQGFYAQQPVFQGSPYGSIGPPRSSGFHTEPQPNNFDQNTHGHAGGLKSD